MNMLIIMELRKTPKLIFKELAILNKPNFIFCGNMLGKNYNKKMSSNTQNHSHRENPALRRLSAKTNTAPLGAVFA